MAGGKGPGEKREDEELMWVAGIGLTFLVIYLLWLYARDFILWFAFALDIAQFWVVDKIFDYNSTFKGYIEFMKGIYRSSESEYYIDPFSVTYDEMMALSKIAGGHFRWVFAGLIAGLGVYTIFRMKGDGFTRSFSLAGQGGPSLAQYQAQHWKVFSVGAQFDPNQDDKTQEPAATPMEWMKENKIALSEEEGGLDFDAAAEVFEKQLGEPWPGMKKAPVYIQALCVAMYFNAKRDKKTRDIKEQIAIIFSTKSPKEIERDVKDLFEMAMKDKRFEEMIEKYASKHAYINTAMYRLLTWSRKNGGVFASAEFRWLKPIDRTLWYTLNNCGRRSYHTEGAGVVSHFNAENIVRGPLVEPHVDQAVEGLDDYLEHQGIYDLEKFFNDQQSDF